MTTYFLLMAFLLGAEGTEVHSPTPEKLVQQLGAEDFAVREAADKALLKLGTEALSAVETGTRSPDPEIAQRCRLLAVRLRKLKLLDEIEASG